MSVEVDSGPAQPDGARTLADQSTAQLVQHAGEQMSRLLRDEVALARAELADKGRRAGLGAGLLGGGGLLVLYGLGALILAAIIGLAEAVPAWLAALLVGVALLLIAGACALLGRRQVRRALPPLTATRSMRADMDTVRTAVRERSSS